MNYRQLVSKQNIVLDLAALIDTAAAVAVRECHLTSLFFLTLPRGKAEFRLARTFGCPIEPFCGANRSFLDEIIKQIFERSPSPHIHNIRDSGFANIVHRYSTIPTPHRLLFFPFESGNITYLILGTIAPDYRDTYDPMLSQGFQSLLALLHAQQTIDALGPQLLLTELFAKEAGHDISIQVQTVLSKLNLVSSGRFTGALAIKKLQDAESEVLAIQRLGEFLGVAVGENYQLREKRDFDLVDVVTQVIDQFTTEAEERHISIRDISELSSVPFWGDKRALEISVGQIILNAIKYSLGNTYISVKVFMDGDINKIMISNRSSISLPKEDPEVIFRFGWRSREAKELHVNGSGIGLFTVRKIVQAHLGECTASEGPGRIVTFTIVLPSIRRIRQELYSLNY